MIMSFVQRDENRNAMGVRIDLGKCSERDVAKIRHWYVKHNFKETRRTNKFTNSEIAAMSQKKKS